MTIGACRIAHVRRETSAILHIRRRIDFRSMREEVGEVVETVVQHARLSHRRLINAMKRLLY